MSWYLSNCFLFKVLKTGKCPASLNRLGGLCIGQKDVPSCKNDQDCPGKELCCRSECEVNVCSSPGTYSICIYSTHWNVVFLFFPFPLSRHFIRSIWTWPSYTVNLSFSKHDYNELTFKVKPVSISLVLKPIINLSVLSNYWE